MAMRSTRLSTEDAIQAVANVVNGHTEQLTDIQSTLKRIEGTLANVQAGIKGLSEGKPPGL